jgi:hypothetical protein
MQSKRLQAPPFGEEELGANRILVSYVGAPVTLGSPNSPPALAYLDAVDS